MGLMSPTHLIFLGILALLLFGAKRLPEMARSLGTGMREFKDSVSGEAPPLAGRQTTSARSKRRRSADPLRVRPVTQRVARAGSARRAAAGSRG